MSAFTSKFKTQSAHSTVFKAKAPAAAPKAPAKHKPTVDTTAADEAQRVYTERMAFATNEYVTKSGVPSGRRVLLATFIGMISGASAMYWSISLIEFAAFGAIALTGSSFLAFLIALVGLVLAVWSAMSVALKTFMFTVEYDHAEAKRMASNTARTVRGWFSFDRTRIAAE